MSSVFKLCDKRYVLDSAALRERRMATHATQTEFASMCGWSSAYQCRLENARYTVPIEVCESTAHTVDSVLTELEEKHRVALEKARARFEKFLEEGRHASTQEDL